MTPDRVNEGNLVYVVGDLLRRTESVEERIEDLNVIRRDISAGRDEIKDLHAKLEDVSGMILRAAIGVTTSLLVFSATIFALFK